MAKRSSMGGADKRRRREKIYKRDKGKCVWCRTPLEFHEMILGHRVALAKGGSNAMSNLVCSCSYCDITMGTASHKKVR